jgi:hypothetical protein
LLTAEATPVFSSGTAPSTAAVSGATTSASPRANSATAGNTPVQYPEPSATCANSAMPAAASSGPTVIGRRGPRRPASRPAHGETVTSSTLTGRSAAPAASALKPRTFWS